jgi:hypothetical protein
VGRCSDILRICAYGGPVQVGFGCHNQTDPLPKARKWFSFGIDPLWLILGWRKRYALAIDQNELVFPAAIQLLPTDPSPEASGQRRSA